MTSERRLFMTKYNVITPLCSGHNFNKRRRHLLTSQGRLQKTIYGRLQKTSRVMSYNHFQDVPMTLMLSVKTGNCCGVAGSDTACR